MKKIIFFVILFNIFVVNICLSESLDEAVLRSGCVIGKVDIPNTLVSGKTYDISWMVQSYVDIRSRFQVIYADGTNDQLEGNLIDTENGSYFISDRKSYEYYFSVNYTVPYGKRGDARIGFHNSQTDGNYWMYGLFPTGVIARPYGTAGKQFYVNIVSDNQVNGNYLDTILSDGTAVILKEAGITTMDGLNVYDLLIEVDVDFPKAAFLKGAVLFAFKDYGLKYRTLSVEGQYFDMPWHENDFYSDYECSHALAELIFTKLAGTVELGHKLLTLDLLFDAANIYNACIADNTIPTPYSKSFVNNNDYDTETIPFEFGTVTTAANKVRVRFALGRNDGENFSGNSVDFNVFIRYGVLVGHNYRDGTMEKNLNLPLY